MTEVISENPTLTAGTGSSVVVQACQICASGNLESLLFLGYLPPVNQMWPIGHRPAEQPAYPAELLQCPHCGLVQLGLIVDQQVLFPPEYPYTSGSTAILRQNFAQMAGEVAGLYPLGKDDLVVDIGSNDGTLLSNFAGNHRVHGIEPTDRGLQAQDRGIPTTIDFFNHQSAQRVQREVGRASLITATNVFAHIENVHGIVEAVLELLAPGGIFLTESHYLGSLIDTVQYDTIYHEHLRYYSLEALQFLFQQHGLEIVHARPIPTHGGSIRVYAAREGVHSVQDSVAQMLQREQQTGLTGQGADGSKGLERFVERVVRSKVELYRLLSDIRQQGGRVVGIGAPSRASTLINYVGLDNQLLDAVLEVPGSHKVGKYMPGTLIPVLEEGNLFETQPDYAMLLSWHIAGELMPKLREKGFSGQFIIPLPQPRIVS